MRASPILVMTPRNTLLPSVLTNVYHSAFQPEKKLLTTMVQSDAVLRPGEKRSVSALDLRSSTECRFGAALL